MSKQRPGVIKAVHEDLTHVGTLIPATGAGESGVISMVLSAGPALAPSGASLDAHAAHRYFEEHGAQRSAHAPHWPRF